MTKWPLPALYVWSISWLLFQALTLSDFSAPWPFVGSLFFCVLLSVLGTTKARRIILVLGFPISCWVVSSEAVPHWLWLVTLTAAFLIYPARSWGDAPFFPTPPEALKQVAELAPLQADALVLDAGSGLGDGLIALKKIYPNARFRGIEFSWPLRLLCAVRCPWAKVWQGDIWTEDWRSYDMVYLFQRPETMPRAVAKASRELSVGSWMVSLEFEAAELEPSRIAYAKADRPVWLYQQPFIKRQSPSSD